MTSEWFKQVAYSGLGWRTSKEMTYDIAMLALQRGIPGDFVECGVYSGASVALMARAILDHDVMGNSRREASPHLPEYLKTSYRHIHLFDSFEGLPEPGPHDVEMIKGGASCPMADVQRNMKDWGIPEELLVYHPGWFEDTVPSVIASNHITEWSINKIAVLRIDCDLYSSTQTVMKYLYPLVSPGGYVIVDDFNLDGCRKAVLESVVPGPVYWRKNEQE